MDDTFVSILMTETVDRVCQSNGKHSPPELINVVFSLVKENNQSKVHPLSLFTKLGGGGRTKMSNTHPNKRFLNKMNNSKHQKYNYTMY